LDCGPVCGNGVCETGELGSCISDCLSLLPVCGNGRCEFLETVICPYDCGGAGIGGAGGATTVPTVGGATWITGTAVRAGSPTTLPAAAAAGGTTGSQT